MENRQLAAIMFTDILGYTSLMKDDEKKTLNLVDKSLSIVKPLVRQYKGDLIKEIGDGTLSCFSSVVNAVKCAVEIQTKVQHITAFKLRIGIHLGDVIMRDHDVFGSGVNIASRMESIAIPGTIFISGQVFDQIQSIPGFKPQYVGKKKLKNVSSTIDIYKIDLATHLDTVLVDEEIIVDEVDVVQKKSIIILPFKDLSPEKDTMQFNEKLCNGLIAELSGTRNLKVISSTSSSVLIESSKSIKQICDDFNIDYVLNGTIKKTDKTLRISTQLIEGAHDKQIWSSKYKGSLSDISSFQKDITQSIKEHLKLSSSMTFSTSTIHQKEEKFSVMEYCYKAHHDIFSYDKERLNIAIELLNEGIEIYGDNKILYTTLGIAYFQYINSGFSIDNSYVQKMGECLEKITKLNPKSSQAYQLKGIIHYQKREVKEAAEMLEKSIELDQMDPVTLYLLSILNRNIGNLKLFTAYAQKLSESDPLVGISQILPAIVHYYEGKSRKAYEIGKTVLSEFSENPIVLFYLGVFAASSHFFKEAIKYFERNYQLNEGNHYAGLGLLFRYALSGNKEFVLQGIEKYLHYIEVGNEELSLWIADIYCLIDEKDLAIIWIRNAVKKGFTNYIFLKNKDPFLEKIRNNKSFQELLNEIHEQDEST